MFDNPQRTSAITMSEEGKKLSRLAKETARTMGHGTVDAMHMMIGLYLLADPKIAPCLEHYGFNMETMRAVANVIRPFLEPVPDFLPISRSPETMRLWTKAIQYTKRDKYLQVWPVHYFEALCQNPGSHVTLMEVFVPQNILYEEFFNKVFVKSIVNQVTIEEI